MTTEHFNVLRQDIQDLRADMRQRFDLINGRLREAEQDVAVLKAQEGRKALVWGTGASAGVVALVEAVKSFFK